MVTSMISFTTLWCYTLDTERTIVEFRPLGRRNIRITFQVFYDQIKKKLQRIEWNGTFCNFFAKENCLTPNSWNPFSILKYLGVYTRVRLRFNLAWILDWASKHKFRFHNYRSRALKSRGSYGNSTLFLKLISLDFYVQRKTKKAKCDS